MSAERSEKRETSTTTIIRSKDVIGRKGSIPEWRVWEHNNTREERDKHDRDDRVEGGNGSVPEKRYGREKSQPPGGKKEERREKREEGDKHDRDDRVEGRKGSIPG